MLNTVMNLAASVVPGKFRNVLAAGTVLAGLGVSPAAVFAHHHGFHVDLIAPVGAVVVQPADPCAVQVWVEPTCRTVTDRQWVAAVYQTVATQVWVPPVTQTQVQRVEVPAAYGYRDVVAYDSYGRAYVRRQQVLISAAHCEDRTVQATVDPGHYEQQTQQLLVADGHWADVTHQEVVMPGHYETRIAAPTPAALVQPTVRVEIPLPF